MSDGKPIVNIDKGNGAGVKHALECWTLIIWGSRNMIGRDVEYTYDAHRGDAGSVTDPPIEIRRFSPIYDLVVEKVPIQTPQGVGFQEHHVIKPVVMLAGITEIEIPEGAAAFIDATTLSRQEQTGLRQLIASVEELLAQEKRKRAGIELGEKMKDVKSFGGGARGDE